MSRAPMSLDEPSPVSRPAAVVGAVLGVLYLLLAVVITTAPGNPWVIRVVYDIARVLKGQLIIEGVESAEDEAIARSVGPVLAQGYRYGHPTPLAVWAAHRSMEVAI